MKRLRSIQILRGVAASMVAASHAWHFDLGAGGVDIFFVVSGFIIAKVAQGRTPLAFLRDRAVRVLPVYWICTVPWLLLALAAGILTAPYLITTVTLWPIVGGVSFSVLKPAWTLSFELLFYLGMAACLQWTRARWLLPALWALALIGGLLTASSLLRLIGNPMILEFGFGVGIASLGGRSTAHGGWVLGLGVALLGMTAFAATDLQNPEAVFALGQPWRWALWGIPAALIVWGFLQLEERLSGPLWRLPLLLGDASYSIYLTNLLTALFLSRMLPAPGVMLGCLLIGVLCYRYIERPLLTVMKRSAPAAVLQPA